MKKKKGRKKRQEEELDHAEVVDELLALEAIYDTCQCHDDRGGFDLRVQPHPAEGDGERRRAKWEMGLPPLPHRPPHCVRRREPCVGRRGGTVRAAARVMGRGVELPPPAVASAYVAALHDADWPLPVIAAAVPQATAETGPVMPSTAATASATGRPASALASSSSLPGSAHT